MDQVLALVKQGRLAPGDRLPTEQELVTLTGVGRATVREAIRGLVSLGIVQTRAGRGTFLRAASHDDGDHTMLPLLGSDRVLRDLVDARLHLDPEIARLAAERATLDDLGRIQEALEALRTPAEEPDAQQRNHVALHLAIVHAAHNLFFSRLWASFATFMSESPLVAERTRAHERSFDFHRQIVEAIARRDAEAAEAAMRRHMTDTAAMLQKEAAAADQQR